MFPFIYNNTWITDDKVLHFLIWGAIFISLIHLFRIKKTYSFLIIVFIAFWKEFFDYFNPKHNVELLDIIFTLIIPIFYYLLLLFLWKTKKNNNI